MSQLYITRYKNIDGVILSGSTASNAFLSVGAFVAKVIGVFNKDKNTKEYIAKMFAGLIVQGIDLGLNNNLKQELINKGIIKYGEECY